MSLSRWPAVAVLASALLVSANDWPEFRAAGGHGPGPGPVKWSATEGLLWNTPIPGKGWSSPVVLGKQIWLTTALDEGRSLRALCVDLDSGKMVYNVEVFTPEKPDFANNTNSHASPTPVIEKGRVYVSFGNMGNACLDTATGEVLWKNRTLRLDHKEGAASSPILWRDLFLLDCDGTDFDYLAALRKDTGKLAWKTHRSFDLAKVRFDLRKAYCTPQIAQIDGKDRILSVGAYRFACYDPETGKELWYVSHPGYNNAPRPAVAHGRVYLSTGWNRARLLAIRLDPAAKGDITKTHVDWECRDNVPCMSSILILGDTIFMVDDNGWAVLLNATDGTRFWKKRLVRHVAAAPVAAGKRVYVFDQKGQCAVLEPDRQGAHVIAKNQLPPGCMASPAVIDGTLVVRTRTHLCRIGDK
ncbi:MAG: PQQ-binding-like beta-propeller repeat protein [Victivallales bacterium]|nr:PQQ-binding-like beta-propeller repeat protein [Victivallales bacterium]